jgi:hypothetical protein
MIGGRVVGPVIEKAAAEISGGIQAPGPVMLERLVNRIQLHRHPANLLRPF